MSQRLASLFRNSAQRFQVSSDHDQVVHMFQTGGRDGDKQFSDEIVKDRAIAFLTIAQPVELLTPSPLLLRDLVIIMNVPPRQIMIRWIRCARSGVSQASRCACRPAGVRAIIPFLILLRTA
jgi:hypothetical protein